MFVKALYSYEKFIVGVRPKLGTLILGYFGLSWGKETTSAAPSRSWGHLRFSICHGTQTAVGKSQYLIHRCLWDKKCGRSARVRKWNRTCHCCLSSRQEAQACATVRTDRGCFESTFGQQHYWTFFSIEKFNWTTRAQWSPKKTLSFCFLSCSVLALPWLVGCLAMK